MKTRALFIAGLVVVGAAGCLHRGEVSDGPGVRSEREFARQSEADARRIYENGQAKNRDEARMKAAAQGNTNWAADSRRIQKQQSEERMTRELNDMKSSGNGW